MSTPDMSFVPTGEDRQWASDVLVKAFHDEHCEYDGMEGEVAVCAGECRDVAEGFTGVAPSEEATS